MTRPLCGTAARARGEPAGSGAVDLGTLRNLLERVLATQAAHGALLGRIVQTLEAPRRGRLGAGDAALLDAIASHVGAEIVFSAAEFWRHAERVDDALRATIAAAGVTDTRALGRRLRRLARHAPGPVRLCLRGPRRGRQMVDGDNGLSRLTTPAVPGPCRRETLTPCKDSPR